jgi:hypothetical protein
MSVQVLLIVLVVLLLCNFGGSQIVPTYGTFSGYGYGGILLLVLILYLIFR